MDGERAAGKIKSLLNGPETPRDDAVVRVAAGV
jgi:hypothetical protein